MTNHQISERLRVGKETIDILSQINMNMFPNPCIVFDIDDTLIDSKSGSIIRPIHDVYRYADQLGYTLFIITARDSSSRNYTNKQLHTKDITGYSGLFMIDHIDLEIRGKRKAEYRELIEKSGYQIIMNIGDDPQDFVGGHYLFAIKLP